MQMQSTLYKKIESSVDSIEKSTQSSLKLHTESRIRSDFRNIRNYQVYEQGVMLALLNSMFDITIKQPLKKANVFEQIVRIQSIVVENDVIDIEEFCDQRCKERFALDLKNGVPMKTAKRRIETNRVNEMLFVLADFLTEYSFEFTTKVVNGKKKTLKGETVKKIASGNFVINEREIRTKGKEINKKTLGLLGKQAKVVIPRGTISVF
ncbi:hypothetical protein EIN_445410 [Entamoeba invadens IP1]|uniref:Uncharacterized protein n=1 Tax=Entamoeba invadens IP1 TaxID=370355 RepID=L7FLJ6_ENTIV|nr:hypothetical protein EIN_445410 [Entamoeba invadens IP1]ELP86904.1 hypothetical protein EIN_445410 [Entamoeba invadens IP1]|eukprot:XP_004253675.1 hypothetical protein EIN_445410 [Entamoeba invadens IP1]